VWYECLDNVAAVFNLYNDVPALRKVRIESINIRDSGNRISLVFDMPRHADRPPKRWGCSNVTSVTLEFQFINSISLSSTGRNCVGNIDIVYRNGLIELNIDGDSIAVTLVSETCFVQSFNGYYSRACLKTAFDV
jgi:hypothetical protein